MAINRKEFFQKKIAEYQKNPVLFAEEVCHFHPDPWQKDVMMDLANYPRVSVRSGHGVGKTGTESIVVLWFLTCFKFPKVICTAPTMQQLNDVLWSEIDKWRSRSPLLKELLTWTKTYVYMNGYSKRWFAVAKTASEPENMQGFHEDNMLFVVDEASGIEEEIMEAILATLSGANNKLLMCANPTRTTGTFYDSHHTNRALYKCHKVSSLDSTRTNKENIAAFIKKYGEDSNVVKVRVFGDFPTQEDDVFIPLPLVEQAVGYDLPDEEVGKITLGVDVARYGDDETIIAQNVGGRISLPVIAHGQNLMKTVGNIVATYRQLLKDNPTYKGVVTAYIDDTGLGGGVTDRLEEVKREEGLHRLEIVPINFGMKPPQDGSDLKYNDITTYMWANIKFMLETRQLSIENDEELVAQLTVRKYSITSNGRIELEKKKDMKSRGIKSPDRADAVALCCYSTNKIYDVFIENTETIVIPVDAVVRGSIQTINIGIVASGTVSLVATAIFQNYSKVIVLASETYKGGADLESISDHFRDFTKKVIQRYGKVDYVYCEDNQLVTTKAIKIEAEQNNFQCIVRNSAKMAETDRIRLTTKLMKQGRFFLTDACETLSRAFSSAVWQNKRNEDKRYEMSDVGTLKAFECTIEREATRLLNQKGG